jgi:metallo-beta-lactamase family protein
VGGLSAHAGQDLLVKYAAEVKGRVKQIFLVHGEARPAAALTEKLKDQAMHQVHYPDLHESVEI